MKNRNKIDPSVKKILDMPSEKRRKLKLKRISEKDFSDKKTKKIRHRKCEMTNDEIIEMIKEKGTNNCIEYLDMRVEGEPTLPTIRKRFGGWENLTRLVFGESNREKYLSKLKEKYSPEYMVRMVIDLDLWLKKDYFRARKKDSETIPAHDVIMREFGTWGNLIQVCRMQDIKCVFEDYRILKRKMGRKPSMTECRQHRLSRIQALIDLYGSKKELDIYVDKMDKLESDIAKRARKK